MANPITNPEIDEPESTPDIDMEGASADVDVVEPGDDAAADTDLPEAIEEPPKLITFLEYVATCYAHLQSKIFTPRQPSKISNRGARSGHRRGRGNTQRASRLAHKVALF